MDGMAGSQCKSLKMKFVKGDIVLPFNRVKREDWLHGLHHPAVVWDELPDSESDFCGIMLTHAPPNGRFDNILMNEGHLETGHQVGFSNTHFVNQLFIKFHDWGPFELVGRLTPNGIAFIVDHLGSDKPPMEFVEYYKNCH